MELNAQEVKKVEKKPKPSLKMQREKDREQVKGIFRFFEVPGGTLEFVFKKYKEDPVEKFTLIDGQIYSIPLGVAKHLNNNCWYPVHNFQQDEMGKPTAVVGKKVRRCGFQSLEFVDIEDFGSSTPSEIVTVTPV